MSDQCNCDQANRLRKELLEMCTIIEDVDTWLSWESAPDKKGRDFMERLVDMAEELKARYSK